MASAITYSLVETAKENGLDPVSYLQHLFEQLSNLDCEEPDALNTLLPWSEELPEHIEVGVKPNKHDNYPCRWAGMICFLCHNIWRNTRCALFDAHYSNSCRTWAPLMLMQWRRSCRDLKPCLSEHVTQNGNNLYGTETSPSLAGGDVLYSTSERRASNTCACFDAHLCAMTTVARFLLLRRTIDQNFDPRKVRVLLAAHLCFVQQRNLLTRNVAFGYARFCTTMQLNCGALFTLMCFKLKNISGRGVPIAALSYLCGLGGAGFIAYKPPYVEQALFEAESFSCR